MSDNIVRWAADPDAPTGMRELLQAASADGPTAAEIASLRAKVLAPKLGVLAGKVLVGMVVIGAGLIGYVMTRPEPAPIPPTRPANTAALIVPAPVIVAPTPAPVDRPAVPRVATLPTLPTPPKVHRPQPPVLELAPAPRPVVVAPPEVSEVALLEQARAALRHGDLAHALELTDRAATRYPDGALVEEREALEIEALAKHGRHDAAAEKWSEFASSYPHSNYRARLQRLIEIAR